MFNFKKKKRKVEKLFDFSLFEKTKPPVKSQSKKLNNKVDKALKASGGNCVGCKKRKRVGSSLFCRKCHI